MYPEPLSQELAVGVCPELHVSSPHPLPCIFIFIALPFPALASVLFSSKFLTIDIEKGKYAFVGCKGVCVSVITEVFHGVPS